MKESLPLGAERLMHPARSSQVPDGCSAGSDASVWKVSQELPVTAGQEKATRSPSFAVTSRSEH
jgi:hypothetical protein